MVVIDDGVSVVLHHEVRRLAHVGMHVGVGGPHRPLSGVVEHQVAVTLHGEISPIHVNLGHLEAAGVQGLG